MVYLDHAATTPTYPAAVAAMTEALTGGGNASSLHTSGRAARRAVEEHRETVAELLGARPSEVIFTAGGTESDNLAVKGIYWARRAADPARRKVLAGAVEHHAVLDTVQWLAEREGADVVWLDVDAAGRVPPERLRAELAADPDGVALVTVMWANNEVGTVQPITELAEICAEFGVPMHSDAVQATGTLQVDFGAVGLAALSSSAHKFGGPPGAGLLLLGRDTECVPLLHGGGQERQVRSGTVDLPSIAGMTAALGIAVGEIAPRGARMRDLRDQLESGIRRCDPTAVINGETDPAGRLPGVLHVSFPGCAGDSLLMLLDARGIECSTGSACSAGVAEPSHVLLAMGVAQQRATSSLRFSLGHDSTAEDVAALLRALPDVLQRARRSSSVRVRGRSAVQRPGTDASPPSEVSGQRSEPVTGVSA